MGLKRLANQIKRRARRFPRTLLTLLLVVALMIGVYAFASLRALRLSGEQVERRMGESAEMQRDLTALYLSDRTDSGAQNAQMLARQEGALTAAASAALDTMPLDDELTALAYYAPDTGELLARGAHTLSESQCAFLRDERPQSAVVLPLGKSADDGSLLAVAAPVCRDGAIAGYLAAFYSTERLRKLLAGSAFEGDGMCFLVAGDGRYVLRTTDADAVTYNFLQGESIRLLGDVTMDDVRADFAAGRSRLTRYETSKGDEMLGYYAPLGVNGWFLFTAVSARVPGAAARGFQRLLMLTCVAAALALVALTSVISYENMRHKKALRESSRQAVTARKMLARLLNEADCLAFFYTPQSHSAQLLNDVDTSDRARLERELFDPREGDDLVLPEDAARHRQLVEQLNRLETPDALVLRLRPFPASPDYRFCKLSFTLAENQQGEPMFLCAVKDEDSVRREALTLRELSRRDGLTRLYNRRACVELINEQLARRAQGTFIYLDLDDFKHINDSNGHRAGDDALIAFAAAFRTAFFLSDILARLGGDEFVVFSPYFISRGNAQKHLARLQQELAAENITFSAGVVFAAEGDDFDTLYAAADKALYAAKAAGKKQFVFAADMPAEL